MPRPKTIRTDQFPYHVTCRTNNRDWFQLPLLTMWEIFSKYLKLTQEKYAIQIISFVLMSNHIHMILQTPLSNIDSAMQYLFGQVSKAIGRNANRCNHAFGNRYKGCLIERQSYLYHVYKYVYRNPVDANMIKFVEEYPFSTLHHMLNNQPLLFKCEDLNIFPCDLIPQPMDQRLTWLNQSYKPKEYELIEKALGHGIFNFSKANEFRGALKGLIVPERCAAPFRNGKQVGLVDGLEC